MVQILTPLLRRNVGQTHTSPSATSVEVDFDLPFNVGIMLKQYVAENANPLTAPGIVTMGLNVNGNGVFGSQTLLINDPDTLKTFIWETEFTVSGQAAAQGSQIWEPPWSDFFKMKGFLIFGNVSLHLVSAGVVLVQEVVHRLFYTRVKLDNNEIALLGQRARG